MPRRGKQKGRTLYCPAKRDSRAIYSLINNAINNNDYEAMFFYLNECGFHEYTMDRQTPLILAILANNYDMVNYLLFGDIYDDENPDFQLEYPVDVMNKGDTSYEPLFHALFKCRDDSFNRDIVLLIIDKMVNIQADFDIYIGEESDWEYGYTPLIWCLYFNYDYILQYLLEESAHFDPSYPRLGDKRGPFPIQIAIDNVRNNPSNREYNLRTLQIFVEGIQKAFSSPTVQQVKNTNWIRDPTSSDEYGPTGWAIKDKDTDVLKILVKNGFGNISDDLDMILRQIIRNGIRDLSFLETYIQNIANKSELEDAEIELDLYTAADSHLLTPILWAIKSKRLDILQLFLRYGLDPHKSNGSVDPIFECFNITDERLRVDMIQELLNYWKPTNSVNIKNYLEETLLTVLIESDFRDSNQKARLYSLIKSRNPNYLIKIERIPNRFITLSNMLLRKYAEKGATVWLPADITIFSDILLAYKQHFDRTGENLLWIKDEMNKSSYDYALHLSGC
jgi:ankyrin repeat protein